MPRKPRILSSTGIYHVILRSVNQHIIFEEDSDYRKFLYLLSDCKEKYDTDIFAYCLMDNHVHLLIYSQPEDLSSFFQSLETRFARWYNNKYERSGHLFQERFHSIAVDSTNNFLAVLIYIHNNPVKAGMCRYPSEYRWSSFNAFYGAKNPLINVSFVYDIAGSKDSLKSYFASNFDARDDELFSNIHYETRHFFTDKKALQIFKDVTNLHTTADVDSLSKSKRNEYIRVLQNRGLTIKQISRVMDISQSTVKRICKMNP